VTGKAARAAREIRLLRDFFTDTATCAKPQVRRLLRRSRGAARVLFDGGEPLLGALGRPTWPAGETKSPVAVALETPRPRLAGTRTDAAHRQRRLDEQVFALVWEVFPGVYARDVLLALRAEDTYFSPRTRRRVPLRAGLVNSRYFGANPAVRLADVEDSLARLCTEGRVMLAGPKCSGWTRGYDDELAHSACLGIRSSRVSLIDGAPWEHRFVEVD